MSAIKADLRHRETETQYMPLASALCLGTPPDGQMGNALPAQDARGVAPERDIGHQLAQRRQVRGRGRRKRGYVPTSPVAAARQPRSYPLRARM